MITSPELRSTAREKKLRLDIIEKDYALGWILIGVSLSSLSEKIIFKGGTALSKVYFPTNWRLSDDLDFTFSEDSTINDVSNLLVDELPDIVDKISDGLELYFRDKPYTADNFLRTRVQCVSSIFRCNAKIEVSTERFIGDYDKIHVTPSYDYPDFYISTYTLNTILAEKLRAIIERGKIRDYYDVWRLLKIEAIDTKKTRELFIRKCEAKDIEFKNVDQFFPEGIVRHLEPYLEMGLTRLSSEPLPTIQKIIEDTRKMITGFFT